VKDTSIAVFGWGCVAPGAPDVPTLRALALEGRSALAPAQCGPLGQHLFVVGEPSVDEARLRRWLAARTSEARAAQWLSRVGDCVRFTVSACAEALESQPGLEQALRSLDERVRIIIGTGLTDLGEAFRARDDVSRAQRAWDAFWAQPERNAELRAFLNGEREELRAIAPPDYRTLPVDSIERYEAMLRYNAFWCARSDQRAAFDERLRQIERIPVGDDIERGPLRAIATRQRALRALIEEFGAPPPPWESVDPQLLWSIPNAPAAEITMLLGLHGPAFAPAGACAAFGLSLSLALEAIRSGDCDAAIIGACDPRPLPEVVAAFHRARLTPACGTRNDPFTELRGTHVAGGACVWIIARESVLADKGLVPIGPRILGAAVSSDAEHMITPSEDGPRRAIAAALAQSKITASDIALWDLHASGTPGDAREITHARHFCEDNEHTAFTARKGQLGHGMGVAGGWELTIAAMALEEQRAFDTGIPDGAIHPVIAERAHGSLVTRERPLKGRCAVKVSLGVGGITSAVVIERTGRSRVADARRHDESERG
jgi:3-oxoacyl-(acyl-carrier-protein) synthase